LSKIGATREDSLNRQKLGRKKGEKKKESSKKKKQIKGQKKVCHAEQAFIHSPRNVHKRPKKNKRGVANPKRMNLNKRPKRKGEKGP